MLPSASTSYLFSVLNLEKLHVCMLLLSLVWPSHECAYTTPHTPTVINAKPAPCQNLFGLLTSHSWVFSVTLEHLAFCHKPAVKPSDCICVCDSFSHTDMDGCRGETHHTDFGELASTHSWFLCSSSFPLFYSWNGSASVTSNSSLSTLLQFFHPPQPIKPVTLCSTPVRSSRAVIQTSPLPQSYVVLMLGPPGLLTDLWRELVRWKAWWGPCPGIWPCPPTVVG